MRNPKQQLTTDDLTMAGFQPEGVFDLLRRLPKPIPASFTVENLLAVADERETEAILAAANLDRETKPFGSHLSVDNQYGRPHPLTGNGDGEGDSYDNCGWMTEPTTSDYGSPHRGNGFGHGTYGTPLGVFFGSAADGLGVPIMDPGQLAPVS